MKSATKCNQTPTPRTNTRWEKLCCSGQSWYQIAEEMKIYSRKLETELNIFIKQLDGLTEALEQISEYQGVDDENPKTTAIKALQSLN